MTRVSCNAVKENSRYLFYIHLITSGEARSREWRWTDSFSSVAAVCFNGTSHDCRGNLTQTELGLI